MNQTRAKIVNFATQIVENMNNEDIINFEDNRDKWEQGIANMQWDEWSNVTLEDVMVEVECQVLEAQSILSD